MSEYTDQFDSIVETSKEIVYADAVEQKVVGGYSGASITIQATPLSRQTAGYPQPISKP